MTAIERFMASVEQGEHWLWTGTLSANGYGRFYLRGRFLAAHRVSLLLAGRDVPDALTVDHLCRVRNCVRPDHLELVTIRENVLRGTGLSAVNAMKTHCPKGHEYTADNTYHNGKGNYRRCRVCMNGYRRRLYRWSLEGVA